VKVRFRAGSGATSITPAAGSMTIMATLAVMSPRRPGRGGRQTE
jgi:hypothetical protein